MSHPVVPAPVRFDGGGQREFAVRPGAAVGYADASVAPIVGRVCSQVARRTGLRLVSMAGRPVPDRLPFRIELAAGGEPGAGRSV